MFEMICTETGYAIVDENKNVLYEFTVKKGQGLYHAQYEVGGPEARSIFLRGVIAALKL